jgi:hypothetical protein
MPKGLYIQYVFGSWNIVESDINNITPNPIRIHVQVFRYWTWVIFNFILYLT